MTFRIPPKLRVSRATFVANPLSRAIEKAFRSYYQSIPDKIASTRAETSFQLSPILLALDPRYQLDGPMATPS